METTMTDKERILSSVISDLVSAQLLAKNGRYYAEDFADGNGGYYAHAAFYRDPMVGELVFCQTSCGFGQGPHPWTIAWYVEHEPRGNGSAMLREVGTDRLCNMDNEKFLPIVGMDPLALLEGEQYLFYQKVRRAFSKGGEYSYRFGGLSFPELCVGRVWVREAFGGFGDSRSFSVDIPFDKRMSVKRVLEAMRAGGYGTKPFERASTNESTRNSPSIMIEVGAGFDFTMMVTKPGEES